MGFLFLNAHKKACGTRKFNGRHVLSILIDYWRSCFSLVFEVGESIIAVGRRSILIIYPQMRIGDSFEADRQIQIVS